MIQLIIDNAAIEKYSQHYKQLHLSSRKPPIINPVPPSLNKILIMRRQQQNALKQKWKDFIVWLVGEQGLSGLGITECDVSVKFFFGTNHRHDLDNYSMKYVFDGLVEAGVIVDDNSSIVKSLSISSGIDRLNPRTELKIIEEVIV